MSCSVRKESFVRLQNPVYVCSWIGVSSDFDCLVTGHQGGAIGLTWIPTTESNDTPHSATLVIESMKTITHIAATTQNNVVALVGSNGNLLLLRIHGPRVPTERLATLVSGAVEMVLGVTWSHSSTSLATLRYTRNGKTLSLRVYSGLNASDQQPSTVTILLPRSMTAGDSTEDGTHRQQRLAWGRDGGEDIIISLTNNTIILVNTQSWQVVSQVKLLYSPRIFTASEGTIFALNNAKNLVFKKVNGEVTHFRNLLVDTCTWVPPIEMLLTAASDAGRQMIMLINKEGEVVSTQDIATASPVLDLAWRGGGSSIVYSTEEGLFSLPFSLGLPSLKELASRALEDTSQLPRRLRYEVLLTQAALFFPLYLLDTVELDVHSYCKPASMNSRRRVVRVSKEYLGQELQLFCFKQPKILHKKNFKLHSPRNKYSCVSEILNKLLPDSILSLPSDVYIVPGNKMGTYFVSRENEILQITFENYKMKIRIGAKVMRGEIISEDKKSIIALDGEESSHILGNRNKLGLVLLTKSNLALFDLLVISLVYILHKY